MVFLIHTELRCTVSHTSDAINILVLLTVLYDDDDDDDDDDGDDDDDDDDDNNNNNNNNIHANIFREVLMYKY